MASIALVFGLLVAAGGVLMMLDAGAFVSSSATQNSGFFGLGASGSQEASINTAAWVGLFLAIAGAGALAFGARGLYVTFEGRGEV